MTSATLTWFVRHVMSAGSIDLCQGTRNRTTLEFISSLRCDPWVDPDLCRSPSKSACCPGTRCVRCRKGMFDFSTHHACTRRSRARAQTRCRSMGSRSRNAAAAVAEASGRSRWATLCLDMAAKDGVSNAETGCRSLSAATGVNLCFSNDLRGIMHHGGILQRK